VQGQASIPLSGIDLGELNNPTQIKQREYQSVRPNMLKAQTQDNIANNIELGSLVGQIGRRPAPER